MRKLRNEELDRLSVEEMQKTTKNPIIIVLDNVRSMHNVGSAFRTADAFLCEKIVLCGITAKPPHREIHKTALGATDSVTWEYHENTLEVVKTLKDSGYKVVSIEQADKSISLEQFKPHPEDKLVLVFGNEIKGVQEKVVQNSDHVIEIPQFGTKHSLNISVSIGVVIWDLINKMRII